MINPSRVGAKYKPKTGFVSDGISWMINLSKYL